MAFPVVESITPTIFSTAATAHLVAMPATVNSGDLLIAMFANNTIDTVTTPSGWTLLHSTGNITIQKGSYYKIADGTEDGTTVDFVTLVSRKAVAHVYRISTWHGTTPPEVGTPATAGSTTPNPPTLSPSWGAADTLWLASFGAAGAVTVSVYPTSYTDGNDDATTASSAASIGSARRELNATSNDPGTFTISASQNWVAQTMAIRPSAASTQTLTGTLFTKAPTFPVGQLTFGTTVTSSGATVTITTGGTVTITGPGGVVYTGGSATVTLPGGSYTWTSTDGSSGSFTIAGAGAGNRMGGSGAVRKPPRNVGR